MKSVAGRAKFPFRRVTAEAQRKPRELLVIKLDRKKVLMTNRHSALLRYLLW